MSPSWALQLDEFGAAGGDPTLDDLPATLTDGPKARSASIHDRCKATVRVASCRKKARARVLLFTTTPTTQSILANRNFTHQPKPPSGIVGHQCDLNSVVSNARPSATFMGMSDPLAKTTAYAGEDEASIRRAFRRRLKSCP